MLKANFRIFFALAITVSAVMLFSVALQSHAAEVAKTPEITATAVAQDYVIKLHRADPSVLNGLASNVEQKFTFSNQPQFKNIYGFSSPASLEFLRQRLQGSYDYLNLDQPVEARTITTNDPGFTANKEDIDRQWALPKVGFLDAWEKTTGTTNTMVAVIDTGVDGTHEDLSRVNYAPGINLLTGAAIDPKDNSDDNGHGTLITGIIAATPNNRRGITGTNWQVTILPIKALNAQGSGPASDISQAIVWAADHQADIINLSLGGLGFGHDTTLADAITYAFRKNVLIVAAAGNDVAVTGGNLDTNPVFPVCDDNGENMVLGVTASDNNDLKPNFANYGKACIDVSAPGRRILSTTNHDPATGAPAPDAYAYASGTSMAVPYVVGQAALLKSLFPNSTNRQLRDRIISTADKNDLLNPTQCQGSCTGLLGAGRINVLRSMEQAILPVVAEGDLARVQETGAIYYISGGKRRLVSAFVFNQRFANAPVKQVSRFDLDNFPEGPYAEPLDGTLLKTDSDPTVYYMSKGLRLPITFSVFQMYHFKFSDINTLSLSEVNSWVVGSFLTPPEGTLVRTATNPTVYWTVGGVLHPINYGFFVDRALNVFPVLYISEEDLKSFPKGDAYIR